MSLPAQLISFIKGLKVELNGELKEDTPLMTSGLFDSLALFELAQWIERNIGAPVDPATFDLLEDWNTIADIINFIEQRRSR
jgi:acyl carrier protein